LAGERAKVGAADAWPFRLRPLVVGAFFVAALAVFSSSAYGQFRLPLKITCWPYQQYINRLYERFGEELAGRGQLPEGTIEIWVHPTGKTYTVIWRFKDLACQFMAGDGWVHIENLRQMGIAL